MERHTTVSVTNGMGRALFGGRGGAALCVGGKEGRVERHRMLEREALREVLERFALNIDLENDCIVVWIRTS